MTDQAPELDVTHVRQARRGIHAFVILAVSLTLGIIAVFGAWAYFSGSLAGKGGNGEPTAQVARSVSTEPSTPKQTGN